VRLGQNKEQYDLCKDNMCKHPGKEIYSEIRQALKLAADNWNKAGFDPILLPVKSASESEYQRLEEHLTGLQCNDIFEETTEYDSEPVDMDYADSEPHSPPWIMNECFEDNGVAHDTAQHHTTVRAACAMLPAKAKRSRQEEHHRCGQPAFKIAHFSALEAEDFPLSQGPEC
jgi:hypothetical protein